MIKVFRSKGTSWIARLVYPGETYKIGHKSTLAKEVMVEVYDVACESTEYEYGFRVFLGSAEALLAGPRLAELDSGTGERLADWVRQSAALVPLAAIDRRWLSQYIGDIQRAWDAGDHARVGELLHDGEFNDRIYYAP